MKKLLLSALETKFVIARKVNMVRGQRVNPVNKLTRPEHECVTRKVMLSGALAQREN